MELDNINYEIRTVREEDLDQLFSMLVDLVKHEGSFDRFKLTRERLKNELFGINEVEAKLMWYTLWFKRS